MYVNSIRDILISACQLYAQLRRTIIRNIIKIIKLEFDVKVFLIFLDSHK